MKEITDAGQVIENRPKNKKRAIQSLFRVPNGILLSFWNQLDINMMKIYEKGVNITHDILVSRAKILQKTDQFKNEKDVINLKFTQTWREQFYKTYGYSYKRIRGSKHYIPQKAIDHCRQRIRNQINNYSNADIVNFDESGFNPFANSAYSMQITPQDGSTVGRKQFDNKKRITILVGTTADGKLFLPILFIMKK